MLHDPVLGYSLVPATAIDAPLKKRSPNYVRTQTASPEVISNLIDSLSAISLPANELFDNIPTVHGATASSPPSPNRQLHFARDGAGSHRSGSYRSSSAQSVKDDNLLYPEDACEPPVIRTSKPPSGLSPLTAPKKKDRDHSLKSYLGRSGGSSASLQSNHSIRSASSFGAISVEAGVSRQVSGGSARTSIDSKSSARGHRSLIYMSSRERLRAKDADRKRATIQGPEVFASSDGPRKAPPQLMISEDTIKEEPMIAESSRPARRYLEWGTSPLRNGVNLLHGKEGESPVENGFVPERGSSLRHSGSPSRKGRKGHGRKGSRHDSYKTNTVPEEDETVEQELSPQDKILKELEAEENEVAHRILELKKQKLMRDKIAGKRPVGVDAGAPSSGGRVSPIAAAELSPTSTVSSMSERRPQDAAKAHKVLGITMQPTTLERRASYATMSHARETRETVKAQSHARSRSLTVNDGEDITPLPINYKLALQTLDNQIARSSSPPSSSAASSKGTVSSGTGPSRSKSAAVGGRSAVSRKTTRSIIMGASTIPNPHLGTTGGVNGENVLRSVSEEIPPRHRSLNMGSPTPSTSSQQQKPALKKNRWSHPDLPAKAEQRHNEKVEAKRNALSVNSVQGLSQTIAEERPQSHDSIDMDVDGYLNSPRLSQRIRHPQTGRVISFSEVGDPQGFAVFVCVGMGLTRYVMAFYDELALSLKLRLITPDRPGCGGSQVDPNGTPLSWPDDVLVICQALKITKFSILAHSAGAVYALATSLRMPQHIRGRVHLLAPWIPPSQMAPIGVSQDQPPTQQLPRSQRFLRVLPPSLLKVANSTFLSATSASLQRTGPKNSPKTKRKSVNGQTPPQQLSRPPIKDSRRESMMLMDRIAPNPSTLSLALKNPADPNHHNAKNMKDALSAAERQRQQEYDERLTFAIWDRATAHANPAADLIVCLETKQPIGFRYEDINRAVVIHHGSKDTRVPADNVRWLGRLMRKCEVRILDGEQHGLMASAQVMGNVLTEMASDWEDWNAIVQGKGSAADRSVSRRDRLRNAL
ncbi:alpha/beta-hydrolase [Amniculicola lignicola CBS 123094]|uniref:Alpha/beta-hydrolase n=1 Tax=Amniculicola lignicola CBS 123094 TaxID=1392246 RepID=A0A6A5W2M7_9PLEO|nr:alpha/beta-hydrolase [Amniculicola lignicola CBS 123094]